MLNITGRLDGIEGVSVNVEFQKPLKSYLSTIETKIIIDGNKHLFFGVIFPDSIGNTVEYQTKHKEKDGIAITEQILKDLKLKRTYSAIVKQREL